MSELPEDDVLLSTKNLPTYIGKCCREWVLHAGARGRCGLCGERPVYLRPDDYHTKGTE